MWHWPGRAGTPEEACCSTAVLQCVGHIWHDIISVHGQNSGQKAGSSPLGEAQFTRSKVMWDQTTAVWRFAYPHTFPDFVFVFSCLVLTADRGHGDIVSYCWDCWLDCWRKILCIAVTPQWRGSGDINKFYIQTSKHLNLEQIKPKAGYLILLRWSWLKICRLHYHCTVLKGKLLSRRQPLYRLSMVSNPTWV